ncbi:MAG: hypothetical protein CMM03_03125 [Rhodopirellula sp.]|nr:hypothetical protein [Rhodopirellula sp.]|tara:strand:+ start:1470 stop:2390 length:921 start_codon:yes stop_codon:yes gene_type:complete
MIQFSHQKLSRLLVFVGALLLVCSVNVGDEKNEAKKKGAKPAQDKSYVRIERSEDQTPLALQTAIVKMQGTKGVQRKVQVDLIGAIHVGEKAYYDQLNERFEDYDIVLYELVAPEGTRIEKGHKQGVSLDVVAGSQTGLQKMLGLSHQLEQIDYTVDNFVHADMSPKEFSEKMAERDESFMKMYFRSIGQGLAMQGTPGQTNDLSLIIALFSKDRERKLKTMMAQQFEQMDGLPDVMSGPDGSTIIHLRNDKALDVLEKQLKDASAKKIGIFYGAGHFDDMEVKMMERFRFKRIGEEWLDAWNLRE